MSYRIQYESIQEKEKMKSSVIRKGVLTVFCFFLFLMAVFHLWPDDVESVLHMLEPFRPVLMVGAFDEMACVLRDGAGITQAIKTFVHHILQEIDFGQG